MQTDHVLDQDSRVGEGFLLPQNQGRLPVGTSDLPSAWEQQGDEQQWATALVQVLQLGINWITF